MEEITDELVDILDRCLANPIPGRAENWMNFV